ncbi:conserved hypothetical protein [Vibrio crassostreae]|nr:conserved hypothetical protein [Vibrio crassostreae]CAK3265787.1 conserved hypothetical protein [Vibrio crassostreae]CAK3268690.1 conserved hypothetical protein [Vibrio crassostreae]CAK3336384.1 conserved hypothetical protein [Vibrio crassostreae]CAK3730248.1 conserved hypothetical protein [Vibrio crassostreae]
MSISGQLAEKANELVRLAIRAVERSSECSIGVTHFSWRNGYYS